jgi:hypothetical protein
LNRPRHSLAMRRQAIEHLIALYRKECDDLVLEAAEDAADFLRWAAKRETLLRDLDELERKRPEIIAVLKEFPGSDITDIR